MTLNPQLVEQLARLTDEQRRVATEAAKAERHRRIQRAVNQVRRLALPDTSWRKAAREIDDAVRNRHREGSDPRRREVIRAAMANELGAMDDVPGAERIRQLFE